MEHMKPVFPRASRDRLDADLEKNNSRQFGVSTASNFEGGTSAQQKEDIEYTKTKTVKLNPHILRENRVLTAGSRHPASAAYKLLRTQVIHKLNEKNWNTVGIVSPTMADGKTLTSINLALSLAQESRHTVMLVDLDLKRPTLHKYFGFEPDKGINDFISQNTPIEEILVNPGIQGLVVLPGRAPLDNSSEMLASPRVTRLVEEIKSRYSSRIIIFDIPPILHADDALAFSPYIDTALMVVAEGKTKKKDVLQAMELLYNVPLLGTVLNKSDDVRALY